MQEARYVEAIGFLQPLVSLNCDPGVSLLLAAAREGSGNLKGAAEVLQQATKRWPMNNSISISLARNYMVQGETAKAGEVLAHFQPSAATSLRELEMAVMVLLADHRLVPARQAATVAFKRDPTLQTLLLLANALQLEGRYKEVVALLQRQRATYGESAAFLVTIAESEFDEKLFDAALADLTRAVAIDPKLYQAHYLRGNALMNSDDVDGAIAEYHEAVALEPGQPRTYFHYALALRAKQDETGEEVVLRKLLTIDSQYAMAHSELGRLLVNRNELAEAVVELREAIKENPNSEQAYYLLSKAYDRLGDTQSSTATAKLLSSVRLANHRQGKGASSSGSEGTTP